MENYYYQSFMHPPGFNPYYSRNRNIYRKKVLHNLEEDINKKKESLKKENLRQDYKSHGTSCNPIFEIFGIQLFFDDILLISLIYFLYNEGVQDQFLFITLILLLLS